MWASTTEDTGTIQTQMQSKHRISILNKPEWWNDATYSTSAGHTHTLYSSEEQGSLNKSHSVTSNDDNMQKTEKKTLRQFDSIAFPNCSPVLSSALWASAGLVWESLEDVTPSADALLPLGDFTAFVGVLAGDLFEPVLVSLLHGLWLSWRPLVNFSCCRRSGNSNALVDALIMLVNLYILVNVDIFTFSASSGTVSSPFTTVNRLVCETGRLRKWYMGTCLMSTYWTH